MAINVKYLTVFLVSVLWILSEAKEFRVDSLLPRPTTGLRTNDSITNQRHLRINAAPPKMNLKILAKDLDHSLKFVSENVNRMQRLENSLGWSKIHVKPDTPLHGQTLESYPESKAMRLGKHALVASKATSHLMHKFCRSRQISSVDCAKHMSNIKLTDSSLSHLCSEISRECSPRDIYSKYRSIDGSCNHQLESSRGQSYTGYKRLLFPDYLDGIQEPRRSVSRKHTLPSARDVSSNLIKHDDILDDSRTIAVSQWARFVAHDLAHTVSSKMLYSGKNIICCENSGRKLSPRYIHPFCAPIEVAKDDKFYSKHGLKCMSYVRSVPAIQPECRLGPLEQMNQATHFLDGSHIYGSEEKRSRDLRLLQNGQLKTSQENGRTFLPTDQQNPIFTYFVSGDPRVNTLPDLTVMHTVWLREHNRIAEKLHELNPNWNDEMLYQEARRLVIAEMQHITYYEWLPVLLGETYVSKMGIGLDTISYLDVVEDPSISNSFATAAMRFSKSLTSNDFELYAENRQITSKISLNSYFNKPDIIEEADNLDSIIRGYATQASRKVDLNFASDITSQLYGNGKFGYDVVSLDIQRGRDHGLPSYTAFRSLCGLPEVNTFADFAPHIPTDIALSLSKIYKDPHDVDLLIGGFAEVPEDGAIMGPTFSCIVADQFLRTKFGDRYFYQHTGQPKPFTDKQLKEIRRMSLARILCDNGDNISTMQPNVFKKISPTNSLVSCKGESIPKLNLNYWKES